MHFFWFPPYPKLYTLKESRMVSEQMAICIIFKNAEEHVTVDLMLHLVSSGPLDEIIKMPDRSFSWLGCKIQDRVSRENEKYKLILV